VAVVVVASSCRLLGSGLGFLSELCGMFGAGGLCACSRLAHPSGISDPVGLGLLSVVLCLSTTAATPTCGVGAPCPSAPSGGTQASWHCLGRARPFGHTLDTVVSMRSVVSDARCPLITSMV
jgi:hypothetical protein